ncbi:sensor domain-containing diguanylate cyclase [Sabulicella rubraurantiaca]|uniref:sensor domain-containing diguanylate cyclase n=1 Tax=Sabulicella rubraurantiaca TaxID=2811429 RepID=UPI001F192080|nr:diguanylate cyclase [Sabulicella rubraurantiaca]
METDQFSGFRLRPGRAGTTVVALQLRVPELRTETSADGATHIVENYELRFDEASLLARIETLRSQGLDVTLSQEALHTLRAACRNAPVRAGRHLPTPEEVARALGPVAQITGEAVLVTAQPPGTAEPVILHVNSACARLSGFHAKELRGMKLSLLLETRDKRASAAGGTERRVSLQRKGGVSLPLDLSEAPLLVEAEGPYPCTVLVARPAEPDVHANDLDSERDELTGLRGEASLLQAIAADLLLPGAKPRRQSCIALFRVNGFEEIAARHGHRVGNAVLLGVADRLASKLRQGDLACRLGDAEFAIYLGNIGLSQTKASVSRLHNHVTEAPVPTPQGALPVKLVQSVTAIDWRDGDGDVMAALKAKLAAARSALPAPAPAQMAALPPARPG